MTRSSSARAGGPRARRAAKPKKADRPASRLMGMGPANHATPASDKTEDAGPGAANRIGLRRPRGRALGNSAPDPPQRPIERIDADRLGQVRGEPGFARSGPVRIHAVAADGHAQYRGLPQP